MNNNQQIMNRISIFNFCTIELDKRKEFLDKIGITLPDILEQVSDWGQIWKQDNVNGHDLTTLRLPINEWVSKAGNQEDIFLDKILDAFRVMKIRYVFQIYTYEKIMRRPFIVAFKENFSGGETLSAGLFYEHCRKANKSPQIESILFEDSDLFWVKLTWGM